MGVFTRVLKKSCETSSMKALPKIIKATNHCQHLLWTLALLVGLAVGGYQLIELLIGYFKFQSSVHIEEKREIPPFPDVTVCHQDREWTYRNLQDGKLFTEYQENISKQMNKYPSDGTEYYLLKEYLYSYDSSFLQNNPELEILKEKLKTKFIMDCYVLDDWEPVQCNNSFLGTHIFFDPYFGYCITYQINIKDKIKALNLILYLDDQGEGLEPQRFDLGNEHGETHTRKIGASITIHPQGSFPDMFTARNLVPTGVDVGFKLQALRRTLLDEPYGDCISDNEAKVLKESGEPGYATTRHLYECNRFCGKDAVIRECGCLHVYYPLTKYDPNDLRLCGKLDPDNISATLGRLKCAEEAMLELHGKMESQCCQTKPCAKFVYDYTTKSIKWPDDVFHLSFYEKYIRGKPFASKFQEYEPIYQTWKSSNGTGAQKKAAELDLIYKNFAQIRIENHQQEYLLYSETPLISPESLFGTIGGLLNLWVGITFITIIEILDFAHQLIFAQRSENKSSTNGAKPAHV